MIRGVHVYHPTPGGVLVSLDPSIFFETSPFSRFRGPGFAGLGLPNLLNAPEAPSTSATGVCGTPAPPSEGIQLHPQTSKVSSETDPPITGRQRFVFLLPTTGV